MKKNEQGRVSDRSAVSDQACIRAAGRPDPWTHTYCFGGMLNQNQLEE
ncbi:hypothetical protein [Synechococcus sp. CBW1108]|nr:hypothetical protein [Synechococcus sp. CBW1108]QPN69515.1 hypothetical protein H8F27_13315 [Synechococcus sp. CBW1108]